MTVIYVTENNCEYYGRTFQSKGWIKLQKLKDVSDHRNILYKVNPMETFLGKSQVCDMTEFSGARDKEVFDGNTNLLEKSEENNKHRYVYIGGEMICSFLINDEIFKYISNIWNNLTLYSVAIVWENICFLTPYFIFNNKRKINDGDLIESLDYLFSKYGKDSFKKLKTYKIHSIYE